LKAREQTNKRVSFQTGDCPAKKDIIFCNGEVFSLDRGLLMGAIKTTKG
jgi:hypothetical protein